MDNIYEVNICVFEQVVRTDFTERYIIDDQNMKTVLCNIYGNKVIDIKTKDEYYLLKKDDKGYLLDTEQIIIGKKYALNPKIYQDKNDVSNVLEKVKSKLKRLKRN